MHAVAGEAFDGARGSRHADGVFVHHLTVANVRGWRSAGPGSRTLDCADGAVDLDQRPGRETSCRVVHIDHAGDAEFACHHRGMRHRSAELGHDGARVGERGGVADVGDLGDEDLPGFQVVDGVRA